LNTAETLITLQKAQHKQATEMIGRAFFHDPLFIYTIPNEEERKRHLSTLHDAVVRYIIRYGEITCTPDLHSAACWLPPGHTNISTWGMIRMGLLSTLFHFRRETLLHYLKGMKKIEPAMGKQHKLIMPGPHWYLSILAVDPAYQGQGLGSQLLRAGTVRADAANLPCYLDTATARNVKLYQRFGFQVVHEEDVEGTNIHVWNMLRPPGGKVRE
jgi:ribosomal protein S18 acetylase RimI-like enzyme